MKNKTIVGIILALFIFSGSVLAQEKELISYKVDGKEFYLTDVKFEYHPDEGWGSIKGRKTEKIKLEISPFFSEYREVEAGIWIDIAGEPIVGKHEAGISDLMPLHIKWYEWIDKEKGKFKEISIQQDDSGKNRSIFTVIFENFGPSGSILRGTFYGKLIDDEGNVYEVSAGKFVIKRMDIS